MNQKTKLIERLKSVNATQRERMKLASEVAQHPESVPILIELMMESSDKTGIKAAWVLEWTCRTDLSLILPHLALFTTHLEKIKPDGSIRAAAKICELLSEHNRDGVWENPEADVTVKSRMISVCFDWLIGPYSTAAKAYSMQTLFILGKREPWIHQELKAILQQAYSEESAGYQARARKVLKLLEKPS